MIITLGLNVFSYYFPIIFLVFNFLPFVFIYFNYWRGKHEAFENITVIFRFFLVSIIFSYFKFILIKKMNLIFVFYTAYTWFIYNIFFILFTFNFFYFFILLFFWEVSDSIKADRIYLTKMLQCDRWQLTSMFIRKHAVNKLKKNY